jgi:hypothetical protein
MAYIFSSVQVYCISLFLCNSQANNEAKGEPEKKKKLKLVKSKNKRQKVTEDKSDMREKKKSNKRVLQ